MRVNLLRILRTTSRQLSDHKEEVFAILTGVSLAGTTVSAIKGQREADKEIEETNKNLAVNDEEPLTRREEVSVSVKHHIGTLLWFGGTAYCIWKGYSFSVDNKKNWMETAAAYGLLSKSYDELQRAVDETGHRDEVKEKVLDNVYQEAKKDIPKASEDPGGDTNLFIEEITGQQFWSTREDVKAVINKINYEMNTSYGYPEQSMDDLLSEFGLRKMGGELGSRIGWDINYTGLIDVKFYRPDPSDDDPNENVWVVGYFNPPKENFGKNYGI